MKLSGHFVAPSYSELVAQLDATTDLQLKHQLLQWRKAVESQSLPLREANDLANREWDSVHLELERAESDLDKAAREWHELQRKNASTMAIELVRARLAEADKRWKAAREKIASMPSSRVAHAQQARLKEAESEVQEMFFQIVSSIVSTLPARKNSGAVTQKQLDAPASRIDMIDLDTLVNEDGQKKLVETLYREFSANPWADKVFIFGSALGLDLNDTVPFNMINRAGFYLCNEKFRLNPILLALLTRHLIPSASFSFFVSANVAKLCREIRHAKVVYPMSNSALVDKREHSDELISSAGDFIDSKRSFSARLRDLECRLQYSEGTKIFERLKTPKSATLWCAGRYFPTHSSHHNRHALTQALLRWKKGYTEDAVLSTCDFLAENGVDGTVITVVPDKPGKSRMRELLTLCQGVISLSNFKHFEWQPDLYTFKESFSTHAVSGYSARYDLVSSCLVPEKAGSLDLTGKKVLLIDDIFTTGATLDALSNCIHKDLRANAVDYFCLARTVA